MRFGKFLKEVKLFGDLLFLNLFYLLGNMFFQYQYGDVGVEEHSYGFLLLVYNFSWLFASIFLKIHDTARSIGIERVFSRLLNALIVYLLVVFGVYGLNVVSLPPNYIFVTYLFTSSGISLFHMGFIVFLKYYRILGYNYKNVIVIGNGEVAEDLKSTFKLRPELGFRVLNVFSAKEIESQFSESWLEYLIREEVQEIFCNSGALEERILEQIIDFADDNLITVKVIPDFRGFEFKGMEVQLYDHVPVIKLSPHPFDDPINQLLKRIFDVTFSLAFLLTIGIWLFPLIGLLIKLESRGPVFFKQKRGGEGNRPFEVLKFRSMKLHDDQKVKQATKGDSRITKIGAFIRKTSIDELPQFINVLMGNMSVVGPRPHAVQHNAEYRPLIEKFNQRHKVKPGITGLAQAKGLRGETETVQMMADRVKMDRFYVENWSFWFDLKIILMTVISMAGGEEKAY
ncbi:undecaprenyl-phosphate glucose phosphotransferase [Persicobacter sp. CCB-QB2]|uniref:undecaprenyl-phosphate glucose phosphotransferase n=1 Tax=Persicobacter sp. CCB-QB2 TaxID=1561025 RepID=UPI0006A978C7|nr:undecaprenyl-phosphate glucose phosphotransferase [Persicobacter sp. CCB-QB2]